MLVAIWATVNSIGFKVIRKKINYSAVFGSKKNYKKKFESKIKANIFYFNSIIINSIYRFIIMNRLFTNMNRKQITMNRVC